MAACCWAAAASCRVKEQRARDVWVVTLDFKRRQQQGQTWQRMLAPSVPGLRIPKICAVLPRYL
jgi:hypothetical protein